MQNAVITAIYGLNGELLGEYRQDGSTVNEYIYLNGQPLALLNQGQAYTLHNDHLGTPQVMSNAQGQKVWQAHYDPFGNATVNEDVDGDGQTISLNLRFPGQYYDQESGLYYNYFRYYDPATGRYLTSDPIGLDGGLNTYGYAYQNPIRYTDPKGLAVPAAIGWCAANPACTAAAGATAVAICRAFGGCQIPDDPYRNENPNEDGEGENCPPKKEKKTWPPYDGPANGYEEGPRRGREYGEDGKPKRDYDKPHQGADYPHVHEWEGGRREHPGRPYSPVKF